MGDVIWLQGCQIGHFCDQIKVTNRSFAAFGRHSSLWPKATIFLRSQKDYSRQEAAIVRCGQRPQCFPIHLYITSISSVNGDPHSRHTRTYCVLFMIQVAKTTSDCYTNDSSHTSAYQIVQKIKTIKMKCVVVDCTFVVVVGHKIILLSMTIES